MIGILAERIRRRREGYVPAPTSMASPASSSPRSKNSGEKRRVSPVMVGGVGRGASNRNLPPPPPQMAQMSGGGGGAGLGMGVVRLYAGGPEAAGYGVRTGNVGDIRAEELFGGIGGGSAMPPRL